MGAISVTTRIPCDYHNDHDHDNHNHDKYYNDNMMTSLLDSKTLIEIFKFAPAIISLFGVIYLLYKIIIKKDETITTLVNGTQADIERFSKMLTLLEILVNRGQREKGDR